jgi:hypothetical protein
VDTQTVPLFSGAFRIRDPIHRPPDSVAQKDEPADDIDSASYEIHLACRLTERGAERFEDLQVSYDNQGNTCLSGRFDQAALQGLLNKIRDLNPVLTSVQRISVPANANFQPGKRPHHKHVE